MTGAGKMSWILFIMACMALLIAPGLARSEPNGKSVDAFGLDPDYSRCIGTLQSVEGCVQEVFSPSFLIQPFLLGPACCKAIIQVNDNCWPKIFPFNPFFPPLLKNYCTGILQAAPAPPVSPTKLTATTTA